MHDPELAPDMILRVNNEKGSRVLLYDESLRQSLPYLDSDLESADNNYFSLRRNSPEDISGRQFDIPGTGLRKNSAKASVIFDERSLNSNHAMLVFSPFNDVAPESSGKLIKEYSLEENPSRLHKQRAKPHSWNQTTKSRTFHDSLNTDDIPGHGKNSLGMPVITVFSPIPYNSYTWNQINDFKQGEFKGAHELAKLTLRLAQTQLHEAGSETAIDTLHIYGASLGASKAVGAASRFANEDQYKVSSLTAQELILGPTSLLDLAKKFSIGAKIGDASQEEDPTSAERIAEPQMRLDLDDKGNEFQINTRILRGIGRIAYLRGLTRPSANILELWNLSRNTDTHITIANAANSGLTADTFSHFRGYPDIHKVSVQGVKGEKADHLINEHVAVSAAIAHLGVKHAFSR